MVDAAVSLVSLLDMTSDVLLCIVEELDPVSLVRFAATNTYVNALALHMLVQREPGTRSL
jgi:hypothetical protein